MMTGTEPAQEPSGHRGRLFVDGAHRSLVPETSGGSFELQQVLGAGEAEGILLVNGHDRGRLIITPDRVTAFTAMWREEKPHSSNARLARSWIARVLRAAADRLAPSTISESFSLSPASNRALVSGLADSSRRTEGPSGFR